MRNTFLTIAEFCTFYRVSRTTAYRQIKAGLLPIIKIGRATRIRVSDAESWAANLRCTSFPRQKEKKERSPCQIMHRQDEHPAKPKVWHHLSEFIAKILPFLIRIILQFVNSNQSFGG
jgi:excisionase family DNA binding protein